METGLFKEFYFAQIEKSVNDLAVKKDSEHPLNGKLEVMQDILGNPTTLKPDQAIAALLYIAKSLDPYVEADPQIEDVQNNLLSQVSQNISEDSYESSYSLPYETLIKRLENYLDDVPNAQRVFSQLIGTLPEEEAHPEPGF